MTNYSTINRYDKYDNLFLWNNGQKIFIGYGEGFIITYERNSDGLNWTRFYNRPLPVNSYITSLVVNN